jgi:hypothetical protein
MIRPLRSFEWIGAADDCVAADIPALRYPPAATDRRHRFRPLVLRLPASVPAFVGPLAAVPSPEL